MKPVYIIKMNNAYVRLKGGHVTVVDQPWQGTIYNRAADAEKQACQSHWLKWNHEVNQSHFCVYEILFDVAWEAEWTGSSAAEDEIPL